MHGLVGLLDVQEVGSRHGEPGKQEDKNKEHYLPPIGSVIPCFLFDNSFVLSYFVNR
jgi:hypothetical protein